MKYKFHTIEKKKYKNDTFAYLFVLLGIVFNCFAFIKLYEENAQFFYDYRMAFSVLYNLVFMLAVFLTAENVKKYHRSYAIAAIVIGALQFLRMSEYVRDAYQAAAIAKGVYSYIVIFYALSGASLVIGGIAGVINSTILKRFVDGKLEFKEEVED